MKKFLRPSAVAILAFASLLNSAQAALPADASNVLVDVGGTTIVKVNAANGSVLWSTPLANDGALAVDPGDFSVYTAIGGHVPGTDGTIYKLAANGAPGWTNSITLNSYCDFAFVTDAVVDATSSNPGVIWSENGCFGAVAKSDRATGAQQWSVLTYDVGRPSVDPSNGQIYTITDAGNNYDAETIYSLQANGTLDYAFSCEGFTDLNPADGQLYRGGGDINARGCGTTLYQLNRSILGGVNWSIDLSSHVTSLDALAVQPWQNGWVYAASVNSSKIVIVDPATRSVVTSFPTAVPPRFIAIDPNGGNVYVADNQHPFLIAYSWTGALVWINPNLGGNPINIATARPLVGTPPPAPTPTPTPSATPTPPPCKAPTVRVMTTATQLHKGQDATITFTGKDLCQNTIVKFAVVTHAVSGVDFTLTDQFGQDATTVGQTSGSTLTLHAIPNSRRRILPLSVQILPDRAYYRGNTKVTVQLLGN